MLTDRALTLLHEWIQSDSLRRHCYAVADSMRYFAQQRGEDVDLWEAVGLLHVGNVDIADFAVCLLGNVFDILLYPRFVIEWGFVSHWNDGDVTRSVFGWFGIHPQDNLLISGAN